MLNHRLLSLSVFLSGLTVGAQTVNLRGAVTGGGGKPVSGAIVTLLKLNLKDTSGADGTYAITKTITGISPRPSGHGIISLSGGVLEFELAEPSPVAIEVFDIKGNLLEVENPGVQGAGHYRWNIQGEYAANQLLIVRASAGNRVSTFRIPPSGLGHTGHAAFIKSPSAGRALAKPAAAVDSLEVTAPGYASKRIMVESYDAEMDVGLTAVVTTGDYWGGLKNPPGKSAGCGKPTTLTSGKKTLSINGTNMAYNITLPGNYDPNTASVVVFIYHWVGGQPDQMTSNKYYGLQPIATAANKQTIFIAPNHHAAQIDHAAFDALLAMLEANACVDTTRVFATGYSHGGMMTWSLTTNHQKKIRAGAGIAAANYNVYIPNPKLKDPIAYMGITGMGDETCKWINSDANKTGAKYIALEKAENNGCTPAEIITWKTGDPKHVTFEFPGCKPGYPVVVATFDGPHGKAERATDPGATSSWVPKEIWEFFMRF
jgi:poly(3-hydroxybutyrate) depolymerase